jgi:predicted nucleic acid-binding protein
MVVADTGALYALMDRSDTWHAEVVAWWSTRSGNVLVPAPVLPELCYLLQTRLGHRAELAFLRAVADGEFDIEPVEGSDYARVAALVESYADLPLGFTDAAIIAVAERLGTRDVLTTDRRHFGVVRPGHVKALRMLP